MIGSIYGSEKQENSIKIKHWEGIALHNKRKTGFLTAQLNNKTGQIHALQESYPKWTEPPLLVIWG